MSTLPYSEESAARQQLIGSPNHAEFNQRLDTNRDGTGTTDMATTADVYGIAPPTGTIYVIDDIRIALTDGAVLDADGFGGIAALTTGCLLEIREKPGDSDEQVIRDLTLGATIKSHTELAAMGHAEFYSGTADCIVQASLAPVAPIRLDGDRGEALVFVTQDDLSGLSSMGVTAVGREYSNTP